LAVQGLLQFGGGVGELEGFLVEAVLLGFVLFL
jgi:hypothetical protein